MPRSTSETHSSNYPNVEFHLRAALSESQDLSLPLFSMEKGQIKIAFNELQTLVYTLNQSGPTKGLQASELHGLGLINLLSHKVIRLYRNQVNAGYVEDLTTFLIKSYGAEEYDQLLTAYLTELPSAALRTSGESAVQYLNGTTHSVSNRLVVTEELLVHILALNNPAFDKYAVIFKEQITSIPGHLEDILGKLQKWSDEQPRFGSNGQNIIDLLMEPARQAPESIEAQLAYIKLNWSNYLGSHLNDLLKGMDHFSEEFRFRGAGPGESQVPSYSGDLLQGEQFSEDSDWMPRVVMIARNSLVWLDQLSKRYGREIKTLRDIPDEELDLLARQGFNVLWLIGLWHRSSISKKIKHWCGNPDAESSAYSLKDYIIDPSIGGPEALKDLKIRAWERGIRLASDMVPNHTGLDSPWLKNHPEWYISSSHPPFPAYSFGGGNLSEDPEINIQLEDHYYDRTDASVVFKYEDHRSGETRYIYHGNDGTSMPWNDTAQLNYLNPELREAIIQTILDVARQFKVIRFDAAMTLAKRHIQRLWYPEPGSGGDIPSRSNYSMNGSAFNDAIPLEFWREVVDRVAKEVPDTLLLAEAFWMMEGYFVRTLGMHRVYNSAFMNMLKMEENSKFFDMIASTLEFDPRILQRFVNFLSNPDEDTAMAQFGKGDKYFGATILMVTLPGLPMFAHAQIEGFEEKYGMEYRRAYWDETPDKALIGQHEDQIFPLMKKRYLFAGASNFRLFPMYNSEGEKANSVIAYTNRNGTERSLILVNNAYESQSGWIKTSTAVNLDPTADSPELVSEDLIVALSFDVENTYFIIFQNQKSKLWYIRSVKEIREQGMYLELSGYESQVYLNFQLVSDTQTTPWSSIYAELEGSGISDFAPMFRSIELEPVKQLFTNFLQFLSESDNSTRDSGLFPKYAPLLESMLEVDNMALDFEQIEDFTSAFAKSYNEFIDQLTVRSGGDRNKAIYLAASLFINRQVKAINRKLSGSMIQVYELEEVLNAVVRKHGDDDLPCLYNCLERVDAGLPQVNRSIKDFLIELFRHADIQTFFQVHDDDGVLWFNKERMDLFLSIIPHIFPTEFTDARIRTIQTAVDQSQFQVKELFKSLGE